jgi:hypothetical protein
MTAYSLKSYICTYYCAVMASEFWGQCYDFLYVFEEKIEETILTLNAAVCMYRKKFKEIGLGTYLRPLLTQLLTPILTSKRGLK